MIRDRGVTPYIAQNTTGRRSAVDDARPAWPATSPVRLCANGPK